jgi:osmotically inducible lipoprotein OsmB
MKSMAISLCLGLALCGCAANRHEKHAAVRGALLGAAGGAIISSVAGGDPVAGAAVGAAGGAALGMITADGKPRRVSRDQYGRSYWVDDHGRWRYVSEHRR